MKPLKTHVSLQEKIKIGRPTLFDVPLSAAEKSHRYREKLRLLAGQKNNNTYYRNPVQLNAIVDKQTREIINTFVKEHNMTSGDLIDRLIMKSDLNKLLDVK
jgi:hypothetical protein